MAKKILIVEDNIVILTMQKQIFEMEGYEIVTAQEGMDALKKIHQEHQMSFFWTLTSRE